MAKFRQRKHKTIYYFVDKDCLGRECFAPGAYDHMSQGSSGWRSTGHISQCCMNNAYHGCPLEKPVNIELKRKRKKEGWLLVSS